MGLFDTFVGEITCPICNKTHTFEEDTKDYDCARSILMLGDYIGKGNANYIYDFDWYCEETEQPIKIGIAIRRGQIVKFLTNEEIDNTDINALDNIEEGLGKKLLYEKACREADGYPEEKLSYDLNPLSEGFKFVAFGVEWEVVKLYRQKEFASTIEYFYEIKSKEHGLRIMTSSRKIWGSNIEIITLEHAQQYPSLYFDKK